jgi:hypothetical protein
MYHLQKNATDNAQPICLNRLPITLTFFSCVILYKNKEKTRALRMVECRVKKIRFEFSCLLASTPALIGLKVIML